MPVSSRNLTRFAGKTAFLQSTSALVLLLASGLTLCASAAEIIVPNGTTLPHQTISVGDTLTVQAGGAVAGTGGFFGMQDTGGAGTVTVNNAGSITSDVNEAIRGFVADLVINNDGVITGNTHGIRSDENLTLVNNGSITGTNSYGVLGFKAVSVTNSNLIVGNFDGVYAGIALGLVNSGSIVGVTNSGVNTSGIINNLVNSGSITGAFSGVTSPIITSLTNSGQIAGGTQAAILGGTSIGTITNSGTISGGTQFAINTPVLGSLNNSGTIQSNTSAVNAGTSIGSVNNSGTITSATFNGIYSGGNIGTVNNTGTIFGQVYGIRAAATLAALSNSGSITGNTGDGVVGTTIGTINNSGSIFSQLGRAIFSSTDIASIVNSGTIRSQNLAGVQTGNGIGNDLVTLTNSSLIRGGTNGILVGGNIGNLTNSGTITGDTMAGVDAASIATLNNSGTISGAVNGVLATNAVSLTNSGTISGIDGISVANLTNLTNTATGTIAGTSYGVNSTNLSYFNNAGTISAAKGVNISTLLGSLVNSGTIIGTIQSGMELAAAGSINNSGSIAGAQYGVLIYTGTMDSLVNSGTIRGTIGGLSTIGLVNLTNSGTIGAATPAGDAIVETNPGLATDTILNLNAGSILIGHVDIHGGTNTLNVGSGLNLALTFDTSVPEIIQTGNSAYQVVGNTVYVVDLSAFASAGVATSDLTGNLSSLTGSALDAGFDEKGAESETHYWIEAMGGLARTTGANSGYGGFAAGVDFGPDAATRYGAFGGAALGRTNATAQTIDTQSFYAGIYAGAQFEDFSARASFSAGMTHGGSSRIVANNTLVSGLETAISGQDSFFVSPGIALTKPWVTSDMSFETVVTANYTGVFSGATAENLATGVAMNASSTHVFDAQALLRLPMERIVDQGMLTGDVHAGLTGRAVFNPEISGTLAGVATVLSAANVQATGGIVAGGNLALAMDGGATLYSGLEAHLRSDMSASIGGTAGIKGKF